MLSSRALDLMLRHTGAMLPDHSEASLSLRIFRRPPLLRRAGLLVLRCSLRAGTRRGRSCARHLHPMKPWRRLGLPSCSFSN